MLRPVRLLVLGGNEGQFTQESKSIKVLALASTRAEKLRVKVGSRFLTNQKFGDF